jgi:hypothetical protein
MHIIGMSIRNSVDNYVDEESLGILNCTERSHETSGTPVGVRQNPTCTLVQSLRVNPCYLSSGSSRESISRIIQLSVIGDLCQRGEQ